VLTFTAETVQFSSSADSVQPPHLGVAVELTTQSSSRGETVQRPAADAAQSGMRFVAELAHGGINLGLRHEREPDFGFCSPLIIQR